MIKEGVKAFKVIRELKKISKSDDEHLRKKAIIYIKEILGNDGGLLLKILQYMGTSQTELDEVLRAKGTEEVSGISKEEVNQILKSELAPEIFDMIEELYDDAFPASVGQVQKARLKSGEIVAIKVQYPNIKKTFQEQLKLLNLLPAVNQVSDFKKWGVNFSEYQKSLQATIDKECDFSYEIEELGKWKNYLAELSIADVPKVYDSFSHKKIYVQEFVEGEFLEDVLKNWSPSEKKDLAQNLVKTYFTLMFKSFVIQGDTNLGNFIFSKSEDKTHIKFIDLGQSVQLSKQFVFAIAKAFLNETQGKNYSKIGLLRDLGFDIKKLKHLGKRADLIVEILLEPLCSSYAYNVKNWNYKNSLDVLLGEDKWWFRSAGGTEFFLFMKSFMGLKNILSLLDTTVFYKKILQDILSEVNLEDFEVSDVIIDEKYLIDAHATQLIVQVFENKNEKVKVSLPFNALFDLSEYLDEEIYKSIIRKGYKLDELIREALKDGGMPKEVFHIKEDLKEYIVSIK